MSFLAAAFVGWQMGSGQQGQGFDKYAKSLGLIEDVKMTEDERKAMAEYAKAKAEKIRKMSLANKAKRG